MFCIVLVNVCGGSSDVNNGAPAFKLIFTADETVKFKLNLHNFLNENIQNLDKRREKN